MNILTLLLELAAWKANLPQKKRRKTPSENRENQEVVKKARVDVERTIHENRVTCDPVMLIS